MHQKKVLGRGLSALIPGRESGDQPRAGVLEIELGKIDPNPLQPRKYFDESLIEELARSIREHGVVQPVLVARNGERYQLIAGERRFRAARKAGLDTIPAVVKHGATKSDVLQLAIIENVQRADLNPIEEAVAYRQLHDEFALTQEEIARRVGKERSTVANALRLLKLPDSVKQLVAGGQLSMGHARALLAVDDRKKLEALAQRVVNQQLNVRQTELLAAGGPPGKRKPEKLKDVFTRDAEEKLTRSLHTKVEIARKRRGGSITIHFTNEDELIRIYEELSGRK
ncbi:MAG TPA: ParB/RepB/Spo0J family partition protein, partial [Thermoanaerobaculia bacterium]|nr:ParB/RepB/Spo0J family partition protein [Thermoanaerobaculia bacterium]